MNVLSCAALYIPVRSLYMEGLDPIGIITALFVVVEGFRESSGSHIFGGVAPWEGLNTKELPIREDSDKSNTNLRSLIHFPLTRALRGFAEVPHLQ